MSFFKDDMLPMLEVYQAETNELVELFDKVLLNWEKQGTLGKENINEVFRCVHTIKSSSAMMGLDALGRLSHRLEDIFALLREGTVQAETCRDSLLSLMYDYSRYVKGELEVMGEEDYAPGAQAEELLARVEALLADLKGHKPEAVPQTPAAEATPEAPRVVEPQPAEAEAAADLPVDAEGRVGVLIKFKEQCPMLNVRAFVIYNRLKGMLGTLDSAITDFEDKRAAASLQQQGLLLRLRAEDYPKALAMLAKNSDVSTVMPVQPTEEEAPRPEEEPAVDAEPAEEQAETTVPVADTPAAKPEPKPENQPKEQEATIPKATLAKEPLDQGQAAKSPQREAAAPEAKAAVKGGAHISIRWEKLMELQNNVGELITARSMLEYTLKRMGHPKELEDFRNSFKHVLQELEENVNSIALLPVSSIVAQLYFLVRDMSSKLGKEINFTVQGEGLEVDRSLLENMSKPLFHLLRNAVDHGIEAPQERLALGKPKAGQIRLVIENQGGTVLFKLSDDGAGMDKNKILAKAAEKGWLTKPAEDYTDKEAFDFIFRPGFSTAAKAGAYSGRGVGMDVVVDTLNGMGGRVQLQSTLGRGSEFIMEVPVSITSVNSLCYRIKDGLFFLPLHSILVLGSMADKKRQLCYKDKAEFLKYEEELLPVLRPNRELGETEGFFLVIQSLGRRLVLVVDSLLGQQVAVEKPLPALFDSSFKKKTAISACVLRGDGSIGFMASAEGLFGVLKQMKEVEEDGRS